VREAWGKHTIVEIDGCGMMSERNRGTMSFNGSLHMCLEGERGSGKPTIIGGCGKGRWGV